MRVCIIGFGYIGAVIGAVLADRGYSITGVERAEGIRDAVNEGRSPFNEPRLNSLIGEATRNGRLKMTDSAAAASESDVVLVTVGTPLLEGGAADLSQIREASRQLAPHLRDGQLVILKSTVPPGTTADVVGPILGSAVRIKLAFCPERLAEGRAIEELCNIPVVVGGVDRESTEEAAAFWEQSLGVPVIRVRDSRTAEMVKLADNLWIDLNVALANELAKLSDRLDIDVLEIIDAANTLPKGQHHVNILVPSVGVGGYCLTKDPWFVHSLGKRLGIGMMIPAVSRNVNDSMPGYSAGLIDEIMGSGSPRGRVVAVLGIAFKNNTGDCRYTPTKGVIEALRSGGYQLRIYDHWVSDEDGLAVAGQPLSRDLEATIKGADCIAFLAGHREFHEIPVEKLAGLASPGALIFDGRMFFARDKIERMRSLGLRYKGVGR